MKISKSKIITLVLVSLLAMNALSASTGIWAGTGFISHNVTIDESEKQYYSTFDSNPQSIESLIMIGPTFDFAYIPFPSIPIGVKLSVQTLFPTGYNKTYGFRTYHGDLKDRNMLSMTYAQSYTDTFGMFIDLGYEYDIYRISKTNEKNNRNKPDYHIYDNHCIFGEIGFLTTISSGYFKFGIDFAKSLKNKSHSNDIIFAGGFKF